MTLIHTGMLTEKPHPNTQTYTGVYVKYTYTLSHTLT